MTIRTTRQLRTTFWAADVAALEMAVERFRTDQAHGNDCHVALFEMVRDRHLHINVTHKHPTKPVPGWAGPASLPEGFVHNRTFSASQPISLIVRHLRNMVFAAPLEPPLADSASIRVASSRPKKVAVDPNGPPRSPAARER